MVICKGGLDHVFEVGEEVAEVHCSRGRLYLDMSLKSSKIISKQDGNRLVDLRRSCKLGHYCNCQIEFTFPGKSKVTGSNISGEVTIPRK